jgi:hypothetical protein
MAGQPGWPYAYPPRASPCQRGGSCYDLVCQACLVSTSDYDDYGECTYIISPLFFTSLVHVAHNSVPSLAHALVAWVYRFARFGRRYLDRPPVPAA